MTKLADKVDSNFPTCPIRNVLSRLGDKWSLLTICVLENGGVMRFNALQKAIPDISQKMLTVTLRSLEEDGLVKREIYPEIPPRVEYSLTPRAKTLMPYVNGIIGWAVDNMSDIMESRASFK